MKKIILLLCFFSFVGCAGFEPVFSTKKLSFYIEGIKNVKQDKVTRKLKKKLINNNLKDTNKKKYFLEIDTTKKEEITSKDPKGEALTYEVSLNVTINVFYNDENLNLINLKESFNFNNQSNKFDLNQYKKSVENDLIDKIYENLIIKLQTL